MNYLLGIDVGTSATKTVLFDEKGTVIASASQEYPLYQPENGWAEQKPEDWRDAVLKTIKEVVSQSGVDKDAVKGIGISGQMHGLVMLDEAGEVIRPSIIWCDQRTGAEVEDMLKIMPREEWIRITANPPLTGCTAAKIFWVRKNEPENYNRCRHILLPKDYIRYILTGVFATEVSDASGMQLLDVPGRCWSDEVLKALNIDKDLLSNIVTEKKDIPEEALIDMKIALITLKYTQSNSVCYVKGGQAIGIGAGQQSRIHCTRLAGQKADNWWLRQSPQVLGLQFVDGIRRADRDNTIDLYIGEDYMDVLAEGEWQKFFKVKPDVFTAEEKRAWLDKNTDVSLGSDAFFPFGDNIERAHKSGVKYVAQPGGSVRDDHVIDTCNKYGMVMSFTGIRLFHH